MNPFGYPEPVWRLFRQTPRAGSWRPREALAGSAGTPASNGQIQLQVKMEGSRIVDARFQAYGCPTTIAVGAWLADWVVGKDLGDLAGIRARTIQEALEIPDDRTHCALLGEDVVKSLLSQGGQAPSMAASR